MITYTFEETVLEHSVKRYVLTIIEDGAVKGQFDTTDYDTASKAELDCLNGGAIKVLTQAQANQLIADWFNAKQQLDHWKNREIELRNGLVKQFYTKTKGTQRVEIEAGWQLVIERGEDYKLDNKEGLVDKALENFDETMAALLVTWKPDISKKTYDALPDDSKAHFNNCLEIKPSSPQVKLEPPKATKG